MDVEGLQRVLVVGGDEDYHRRNLAIEGLQHTEPVHDRHLHVQEEQIGTVGTDRRHRFAAVAGLGDHLDVGLLREQGPDPLACERLVVHDAGSYGCHAESPAATTSSGCDCGISSVTSVPPFEWFERSSVASGP